MVPVPLRYALSLTLLLAACGQEAQQEQSEGSLQGALANDPWPTYNRTLDGQRFSPLNQITTENVSQLQPVCEFGMGEEGGFQAGPVVIGDTMFVTTAHTTVALNAGTCGLIWRNIDSARADDPFPVNRGVAYLGGRIYRGSPGGRLVSLSSSTGELVWEQKIANGGVGEFLSSASIAWDGKVFIGLAGGDWGIRGAMMAFDAATGAESWSSTPYPWATKQAPRPGRFPRRRTGAAARCGPLTRSIRQRARSSFPWAIPRRT